MPQKHTGYNQYGSQPTMIMTDHSGDKIYDPLRNTRTLHQRSSKDKEGDRQQSKKEFSPEKKR